MLHLLSGSDLYRVSQKKRAWQAAFLLQHPGAEVRLYDFEDQRGSLSAARVLEESEGGLFGGDKLMVLYQASLLPEGELETLLTGAAEERGVAWLLVEPGTPKKTGTFAKLLKALPHEATAINLPSAAEMPALMREMLREQAHEDGELTFEPAAAALLLERVGTDTARLAQELRKIASFQEEGSVTRDTVALLIQGSVEDTAFQALDALARGDRARATGLFREATAAKGHALPLLGLCAWQVRQLLMVREAYDQGLRQSQAIATASGVSPFVVGKLLRIIERFPLARLRQALALLAAYDVQIKRGEIAPDTALDLFLWKI